MWVSSQSGSAHLWVSEEGGVRGDKPGVASATTGIAAALASILKESKTVPWEPSSEAVVLCRERLKDPAEMATVRVVVSQPSFRLAWRSKSL